MLVFCGTLSDVLSFRGPMEKPAVYRMITPTRLEHLQMETDLITYATSVTLGQSAH